MLKRVGFLWCLLTLLTFPAQSQDELLPFAYVSMAENSLDLWVLDTSGQVLHNFATELQDCPLGFSDDRAWMLYYQADLAASLSSGVIENFLLNVQSGETYALDTQRSIADFAWSGSGTLLAYLDYDGNLGIYEPESQETIFVTENEEMIGSRKTIHFQGRTLNYAMSQYGTELLRVYRWDGTSLETKDFHNEAFRNLDEIEFSPNGRFLRLLTSGSDISLLDLETEALYFVGSGFSRWLPDEAASLFYLWEDGELPSGKVYNALTEDAIDGYVIGGSNAFDLSPDGDFLNYFIEDELGLKSLWQMNRQTGESALVAQDAFMADVEWLSDTQFMYLNPPQTGGLREAFVYDVLSQSNQQVTNQAEMDKTLYCELGEG